MKHSQSNIVNVKIYSRDYTLRTSGDRERLEFLGTQVDTRMREIAKDSGTVDTLKVAVLAALSLADDLLRCKEELQKIDETVSRRSLECVSMLDRFLH